MADSLLFKVHSVTPASESDSENTRRNASVSTFRHVDREIDSCADSCLFQAVNYFERSSLSFPAAQSALSPIERVSESNLSFQDCVPQQPELHFSSEIPPASVHQPGPLGFYPQLPSLVSPTTIPNMISNSLLLSNTSTGVVVNTQSARTSVTAATDHSRLDRQQMASRSEPSLTSTSFASIVAWRRNFSFPTQGDCLQLGEGETCHPHSLAFTPSSSYASANNSDSSGEGPYNSENMTSRRAVTSAAASDSGRSSPSAEFMLSTGLGYTLTPRGNVRPDSNIRTNPGTRPSGHRLNTSALRVFRPTSSRGSTSIRSRRISSSSRSLSPLNIGLALYHPSNDGDNLPVLLSPSDRSDRDRPPTPIATSQTQYTQTLSEDSRSRFIHPGTPIQMHLPELPSLLEVTPSDQQSDGSASEIWLVPSNDTSGGNGGLGSGGGFGSVLSTENSFAQDDEDAFGCDKERAKELLDGLESVEPNLVRRYGKVRGEDICIICRDTLLRHEHHHHQQQNNDLKEDQIQIRKDTTPHTSDSEDLWNLHALACLPFSSSSSLPNSFIHAFPCAHLFHTTCLFPWLSIKTTCPTCRFDIDPHSLTLRIRQWFGISDSQEPTYVNVDILGRRIPWHRPPAPSIEEWIQAREIEIARKQ